VKRAGIAWLAAAIAVGTAALAPPLDRLADRSFTWHMSQHLVLLYCLPLLVLLARPFEIFTAVASKAGTAWFVRTTRPLHALASPPVALGVFVATLWLTHFSGLYERSLESSDVHVAEHLIYLAAGTLFWLPVLAPPPLRPWSFPARLLYLTVALPQGALLGMALFSARTPLYPHYVAVQDSVSAALRDQHEAAALMWIAGGLMVFGAFLTTLAVWARRETIAGAIPPLVILLLAFALHVAGAAPPAPIAPSYTDGQAIKGQILFYENCAECHGASLEGNFGPALAGGGGNVQWETVSYVWTYMTAHMPAGNAGGLRPSEYLEIMAFLLKTHGHAPGTAPLSSAAAAASKAFMGP
jgi:putative membrane protein